jgi:transcription factor 1
VQRRKRAAIDAEMCTEWITEVAGTEGQGSDAHYHRWRSIDAESTSRVLERMRAQGTVIPSGRESKTVQSLTAGGGIDDRPVYSIEWPFYEELKRLEHDFAEGKFAKESSGQSSPWTRLKQLRYRVAAEDAVGKEVTELLESHNRLLEQLSHARTAPDKVAKQQANAKAGELLASFDKGTRALSKLRLAKVLLARDNLHVFHQSSPVLSWDRRTVEPLVVKPTEFFPNNPCALIDIQPRAVHPLLRQLEASNTLDAILPRMLLLSPPLGRLFDSLAPGAANGVLSRCSTLREPNAGGIPIQGLGEIWPRAMNEAQIIEVLEKWLEWPFAPSFAELAARAQEDGTAISGDEEDRGNQAPMYDLA